ncbi:MAG: peptidoglycan-binding domain-containing protein [Acidimicrobiia bacterium]|nr:peptidoglycan-binding domain-containing protein [Acidimicrobiia bacterium]
MTSSVNQPPAGGESEMLKSGAQGPKVKELQRALQRKGISAGAIDGAFGPKTEDAVKEYQKREGLVSDGIAGPATLGSLGLV